MRVTVSWQWSRHRTARRSAACIQKMQYQVFPDWQAVAQDWLEVAGLGRSGPEAIEKYWELKPDILLMDIQMPGGDGLSAAEQILAHDGRARIVFLTFDFDRVGQHIS